MDKLKNILNKCDSLETKHKDSLHKLQTLIEKNKLKLSNNSEESKELNELLTKAKKIIMTPEQLKKLKNEQKQIMDDFENIHNSYNIDKVNPYGNIHTEVKPVQIVNVYKNGALVANASENPQFIPFNTKPSCPPKNKSPNDKLIPNKEKLLAFIE